MRAAAPRQALPVVLALILGLAGAARAQAVKDFKDWTAVCDNLRSCTAYGFSAEAGDAIGYLKLARSGGPNAPAIVTVQEVDLNEASPPGLRWRLSIDGVAPAGMAAIVPRAVDAGPRVELTAAESRILIAALRKGSTLTLSGGKAPLEISLSGAAASLLWIDDRQGRVGTVTALAAPGPKPASAVPPAPPAPVVHAARVASQAGLPTRLPAGFKTRPDMKDCDTEEEPNLEPVVVRLAGGQRLWAAPCSAGAYNVLYETFLADEAGKLFRPFALPQAGPPDPNADTEVMNLDYDATTGILSSFAKARGIGDCGDQTSWVWDGRAFQVVDDRVMSRCNGVAPDDWPSFYHAEVRR